MVKVSYLMLYLCFCLPIGLVVSLSLRILTYNIRHGENMQNKIDLKAISNVIQENNPDFVALQEVDDKTNRTGGVDQLAYLADSTKMFYFFSPHREFDGGLYGNGILSKWPIVINYSLPLPHEGSGILPITAGVITANFSGHQIMFTSTHLDYRSDPTNRLLQVNKLISTFKDTQIPAIICGDFNSKPTSLEITDMKKEFTDVTEKLGNTFPSDKPDRKIDYIFLQLKFANQFKVVNSIVIPEKVASDHRPVFAQLEFD